MNVSILNIGDELLIGQVVNTNASWMAEQLNEINAIVKQIVVCSDSEESIKNNLRLCMQASDVVIITGGLGPTKDDITKSTLCKMFDDHLVDHEPTRIHVENYFRLRNLPMLEVNKMQSMVPSRCTALTNETGSAPGMWFDEMGKIIISLPGVPFEMKHIMEKHVLPRLAVLNKDSAVVHRTILTCGIGESFLAEIIAEWEDALPENFKLAYLPKSGQVRLRLSAYGCNHKELQKEVNNRIEELEVLVGQYIYGYEKETLITAIGNMLRERGATISTAESCTGGNVSALITAEAGASDYYVGGIVCYDNKIKQESLNVSASIINTYGAVSEECAKAMAIGCLTHMGTDYAIATTGISGPNGGSKEKPVGTVYVAIASKKGVRCTKYNFKNIRTEHQMRTANQALFDLFAILKEE